MSRSPRHLRTALVPVTVAVVLAGLLMTGPTADGAGVPPRGTGSGTPPGSPSGRDVKVTLITGDVVTLSAVGAGRQAVSVERAPGSTGAIHTQTIGHDLYVLPEQVLPYVAAHRLDRRLFDVTQLVKDGYDDAHTPVLPLIVEYTDAVADPGKAPTPAGAVRGAVLSSIDGAALGATKVSAASFWSSITPATVVPTNPTFDAGIAKIYLDGIVKADLAESVAQIGAPDAWAAGYDGSGSTVAVLDTGIDAQHPDLAGQVVRSTSFVPGEKVADYNGHGTHVASTIAGTGAASGGVEKGVAPGAHLVVGKVLGNDGFGQESWIISGMEWAAPRADVVNLSLGSDQPSDGTDPMDQAVNTLTDQTGALFVIAAGNNGAPGAIGAPGAADDALTVGAVDKTDQLAWFSNMGPRFGDSALKPDIVAPGVDILAARSHYVDGTGDYQTMSGTSMATPHVAGAAAILTERHPGWTGQQIKDTLMSTAKPLLGYTPYEVGTGRVDVKSAVLGSVHATGSRFFGFLGWPNAGIDPIRRSVTYSNTGDQAVRLALTATFRDASGAAAPAGLFTLAASKVTVPAHGTKKVTVTADPDVAAAGTRWAGTVTARTGGETVTRTSLALDKEAEKYDVTLRATGRDGQPAQTWVTLHASDDSYLDVVFVDGQSTVRLPAGTYSAMTFMDVSDGPDAAGIALLGSPEVTVDRDQTVALDASKAVPVTASVGRKTEATFRELEYYTSHGVGFDEAVMMPVLVDNMYASPTAKVTGGDFEFVTRWRLRRPSMQVTVGRNGLDALQQAGSAWLDGRSTQQAVYAGHGSEADYDGIDATGKAVVITHTPDMSMYDAAQLAHSHGAVFLLVVNDQQGELSGYAGGPNGETTDIPVAGVSGLEGAAVVQRVTQGGASITTSGSLNTPWTYDLVDPHEGRIPGNLAYTPAKSELARATTQYHGNKEHLGGEFRYSFRPQTQYGVGFPQYIDFPTVRHEWMSVAPGTRWYQGAEVIDGTWDVRGDMETYQPGERTVENWFDPVVYPRLGPGFWGPVRQGDFLQINLPSFGDGGHNHTGSMDSALTNQEMKLYQGKTLIASGSGWQALNADVTPARAKLRATSDVSRSAADWGTSTRIHSVYQFWSEHVDNQEPNDGLLPFVQVGFDVETDLADDAVAGATDTIGFSAWNLPNVSWAGKISGGSLDVSYDGGKTWDPITLQGPTGDWKATLTYPDDPSRFVSLRATAWDDAGNRASQQIIRAYGLR